MSGKDRFYRLMQGDEACAEGALAAGMRFFAGYPITPASEIAEYLSQRLPEEGGVFIQMEDEIASMGAIIGASLGGMKSMTATSGPGFSLMQENLGYASMAEVPCVVVDVQRLGPSTGSPTAPAQGDVMQARWGTHGDHAVVVLSPSSVKEVYQLTVKAFNIAEELRLPVVLLMDEVVAHMRERVDMRELAQVEVVDRKRPATPKDSYLPYGPDRDDVPALARFGDGYHFHVTGLFHDSTGFPTGNPKEIERQIARQHRKLERYRPYLCIGDEEALEDAEVVVLAYGGSARPALAAVRQGRREGLRVGLIRPTVLWPFPEETIYALATRVQSIVVPEMNLGQLALEVERSVKGECRVTRLPKVNGELFTPEEILAVIRKEALSCPSWRLRPIYEKKDYAISGVQAVATA